MESPSIRVQNLVKRYPKAKTNAVDGVTFEVARGEIFGLLGPNGAGKTTTIGVLTTAIVPTEGSAYIMGADVAQSPIDIKQRIAVVPQQSNLDRSLKVREILTFHGAYHSVPRKRREALADQLLGELGLGERKNEKVSRYSGGMAQRLMIARALMHDPDVLFLDEPTNNLDPQSRLFLWERIRELNAKGLTILLTTHDMDEADKLCHRIAIMDHGKILVDQTSAELKKLIPGGSVLELRAFAADWDRANTRETLTAALRALPGVTKVDEAAKDGQPAGEPGAITFRVYADAANALIGPAAQAVVSAGRGGPRHQRQAAHSRRSIHFYDGEASAVMSEATLALAGQTARSSNKSWLAINAFLAILQRDLVVTGREFVPFLLQALMQPLFFLFIFGKVLPNIGLASGNFASLMLPGIVALTGMIAAMQGVTLPLVLDLGFAREIDDRLLSPLPVWWVALEKVLFGAIRGAVASSVIFPLGWWILGSGFAVRTDRLLVLVLMILLTGLVGSTIGLLMGTVIKPDQISLMFTLIFTPLLFTGCTYYPWGALGNIRWFQVLTLFNPLTYAAEGLRYSMVPPINGRPLLTLGLPWILIALGASVTITFILGTRTFRKRVVS